jgi:hypothetical protein
LKKLTNPEVPIRFDVVEVLLPQSGKPEIRHLPNTFSLSPPYRHG